MIKLSFHGAAKTVTGSKHLIETATGKRILLDCGLYQGRGKNSEAINRHFGFDPKDLDYVILSHAHIDHCGLLPKLVKDGFRGPIFATPATADLCEIMLTDSAHIQEQDVTFLNKHRKREGKSLLSPLYTKEDVPPVLDRIKQVEYGKHFRVDKNLELTFSDAGHILGSASVHLAITEHGKTTLIGFTGDIGRYNNRILKNPQPFPQCDYLICESTYGDRLHDDTCCVEENLLQIVKETCVNKGGKLLIPAFSVGRTQEIVNVLNNLEFEKKLPPIPVYVDSPMAVDATEIMRAHTECFNQDIKDYMLNDPTPFGFRRLQYIRDVEASIALNYSEKPCIIISASGMAEAGRIKHHLSNNIQKTSTTVLFVGWATPESLAGRLKAGEKTVNIFGKPHQVEAEITELNAFSAHGDQAEMLRFLRCQKASAIKKVFLVHGDEKTMITWADTLKKNGFPEVEIPNKGETFRLG